LKPKAFSLPFPVAIAAFEVEGVCLEVLDADGCNILFFLGLLVVDTLFLLVFAWRNRKR